MVEGQCGEEHLRGVRVARLSKSAIALFPLVSSVLPHLPRQQPPELSITPQVRDNLNVDIVLPVEQADRYRTSDDIQDNESGNWGIAEA